jgi:thiamine monophosphate synthase
MHVLSVEDDKSSVRRDREGRANSVAHVGVHLAQEVMPKRMERAGTSLGIIGVSIWSGFETSLYDE